MGRSTAGDISDNHQAIANEAKPLEKILVESKLPVQVRHTHNETVGEYLNDVFQYPKALIFPDDDPFEAYRGKTAASKLKVFLFRTFPIIDWLFCNYDLADLKGDIVGGLSIATLAIPQDIAYSRLAHLPPINGLHSSFLPPIIYSLLGSSKHLAIGPTAVLSLILGQLLRDSLEPVANANQIESREDPNHTHYYGVAITTTFFVGIMQLGMGIMRLGFVIDFLSQSVIVGFMSGAAITIALQQLSALFGYDCTSCKYTHDLHFTKETDAISVIKSLIAFGHRFNYRTFLLGFSMLCYLFVARHVGKKYAKLIYVATTSPIICVIFSILFLTATKLGDQSKHGNQSIVRIPKFNTSVNPPSISLIMEVLQDTKLMIASLKTATVCTFIALTEASAVGRSLAALKGYQLDGNKEMIACGSMNLVGSFTSCFITTGSFSRSAVNYRAGTNTPLANIIMAFIVLLTMLFLTPLFRNMPTCVLSTIIISAVIGLIDVEATITVWKTDKGDFLALLGAFFGTVFVSVEAGLMIALGLSMAKLLVQVARPRISILGNVPGTTIYRNIEDHPEALTTSHILVVSVEATLYFVNSNYVRERILGYVRQVSAPTEKGGTAVQYIIMDMSSVMEIDCTAIHTLCELHRSLKYQSIQLALANTNQTVLSKMDNANFLTQLDEQWLFLSINDAVKLCSLLIANDSDLASDPDSP